MVKRFSKSFTPQPYLIHLLLFIDILLIFIIIIFYQFGTNIFLNVSLDSSRYLLSAMAQALAAILAIVVGFSFVAFQLSAKFGSPRVFDLFLKGKAFWWLLIIYGFSIVYDLVLLRMLTEETVEFLVNWINFSVFLCIISFISLFPYAYVTIDQLKPEKFIQGIIKIKNDDVESLKRDTILPIVDILNKALRVNGPHTLKVGLEALEKLNLDRINSSIDSKDKLKIAKYYTGKISRLVEIALIENDESAVIEITESLGKVGLKAIESRWIEVPKDEIARLKSDRMYSGEIGIPGKTDNYDEISKEIKQVLSNVGKRVIERGWYIATKSILDVRGNLLIKSYEERNPGMDDDIFVISNDFSCLSKEEKLFSMQYFMGTIRNIVIKFIQKDIYFEDWQYNVTIKNILGQSLEIIDKDTCSEMDQIIDYIVDIGIEAVKNDHKLKEDVRVHFKKVATSERCLHVLISNIGNRGYSTASYSEKLETIWICSWLKEIGIFCALKLKLDEPTTRIFGLLSGINGNFLSKFEPIYRIARKTEQEIQDDALQVTRHIIEIIKELGDESIENGLEKSSRETLVSLIEIGMMNEDIDLKNGICETLKHMREKLENKKIFKSAIGMCEKKQGHELDKFQKFKEFCRFDKT
ncbi:MAG: DUF2254 domain-containing protein [Methanosarcinales archaeon]|nr:MAG: DUF2254 domain-containing protein [Methanosarcinales archaeon]